MSNLVSVQAGADFIAPHGLTSTFLKDPPPHGHAVQFYESDAFLTETVARFLGAGLDAGDRLLVIATKAHTESFMARLGKRRILRAVVDGQITFLDAEETLSKFMTQETPEPELFRQVVGAAISQAMEGHPGRRLRAYGEMVDVLWREGNAPAAIRLEELWNEAGKEHSFSLLCAYSMGNFYKEGDSARFIDVCHSHSHVIPTEGFPELDGPQARMREVSLLQQRARALEAEVQQRRELEVALREALRERGRVEEELRACVTREQQARQRAEESDSFKEMFLGILGHDLRNPLNTVLTTVRLMKMRGEVPPDSQRRLDRVVASGVRMERMIQQLLDVARARLADGIPVARIAQQDLVVLAAKIVDELQAAHPSRRIDLRSESPCLAQVDADRMEQVMSNLIGNALAYGDPEQPVTVTVVARGELASISVHNFGPPIDAATMPNLFDPFRRGRRAKGSTDGLGLGLYIAERIVSAHGGTIDVESSLERGTRFQALLPRMP